MVARLAKENLAPHPRTRANISNGRAQGKKRTSSTLVGKERALDLNTRG